MIHLTRQFDIIPESILNTPITVIGVGAIGSFTVLSLAKCGFNNITIWDFDKVDDVNLNCQFYRFSDIGKPKVDALKEAVKDYANVDLKAINDKWTNSPLNDSIVINAADSMEVREKAFDRSMMAKYFIDGRMGAEQAQLYVVDKSDLKACEGYEKSLFPDSEAPPIPCTAKATIYTATLIAGQIVKAVKDITTEKEFIKFMSWNIADNKMDAYSKNGDMLVEGQ